VYAAPPLCRTAGRVAAGVVAGGVFCAIAVAILAIKASAKPAVVFSFIS
jgi:hypothetical protein